VRDNGQCADLKGSMAITSQFDCNKAAESISTWTDIRATRISESAEVPGCSYQNNAISSKRLIFNDFKVSDTTGSYCTPERKCMCKYLCQPGTIGESYGEVLSNVRGLCDKCSGTRYQDESGKDGKYLLY
jgi:hypothetical protein